MPEQDFAQRIGHQAGVIVIQQTETKARLNPTVSFSPPLCYNKYQCQRDFR
jgi:hypothetical protein